MKKKTDNLIKLAKEYRSFSHEANGWSTESYFDGDLEVRCYFADESDYTAVSIGEFDVNFHNSIELEIRYNILNNKSLEELFIKGTKLLKHLRLEIKKKTKEEKEKDIKKRKEVLEKELESIDKLLANRER